MHDLTAYGDRGVESERPRTLDDGEVGSRTSRGGRGKGGIDTKDSSSVSQLIANARGPIVNRSNGNSFSDSSTMGTAPRF